MKKLILSSLLFSLALSAKVHYAKVEPLQRATIKSSTAGIITRVDLSSEGKIAGDGVVIQIDDHMDRVNLKTSKSSLSLLHGTLKINKEILKGLEKSYLLKKAYFDRVNSLKSSTTTQKDNAYSGFIASKNQWLATKEKVVNLKKQILDLEYKISLLKDSIAKKSIKLKGRYMYKIMVRAGEYATPGMPLAIADDLSKAKAVIYLSRSEIKDLESKKVYIDGSEDEVSISRLWRVADEKFISEYKAEIILEPKYPFSTLLKLELK